MYNKTNLLNTTKMHLKLIISLIVILAVVVFVGCGAATAVIKHDSVPSDQAASKLLPSALVENNWQTTTSNGLPPDEVAVGNYGNFKVFAVKFNSPEEAYNWIEKVTVASENCNNCTRDSAVINNRGYLKYRGSDLGFTLGGEALKEPFMVWNNGQWVFAIENTGTEDFRDQASEAFSY